MAIELFRPGIGPLAALACVESYLFSGYAGIYHPQRVGEGKFLHLSEGGCLPRIFHFCKKMAEKLPEKMVQPRKNSRLSYKNLTYLERISALLTIVKRIYVRHPALIRSNAAEQIFFYRFYSRHHRRNLPS